jgi:hypothetical protein
VRAGSPASPELAEFGALHGVGAQRIAGVFPLAQQIAPQVSEIRKSWIVHGVPHLGGIVSPVFICSACLPVRARKSVGSSQAVPVSYSIVRLI